MNNPRLQATVALFVLGLSHAPIAAQTRLFVAMGFAELQGCGPDGCPTGRMIELDVDNVRVLADTPVPLATRNSWRQLQITADARYLLWTGNDGSSVGGMAIFDTLSRTAAVAAPYSSRLLTHPRDVKAFIEDGFNARVVVADHSGTRLLVSGCGSLDGMSEDGSWLLAGCAGNLQIIDATTGSVKNSIQGLAASPLGFLVFSADGTEVYRADHLVATPGGGGTRYTRYAVDTGSALDTYVDSDQATMAVGYPVMSLHRDPLTNRLFRGRLGGIRVMDASPLAPVATLPGPAANSWPFLAFDPDGRRVFVAWETLLGEVNGQPQWRTTLQSIHADSLQLQYEVSVDASTKVRSIALVPRPPQPTGLAVTVTGRLVSLQWVAGAGPATTGFVVEAGSAPGLSDLSQVSVVGTTLDVDNVPPGTYHVRVRPTNALVSGNATADIVVTVQ